MIASIQHKGLKLLWTKNDASKLPAEQVKKILNILTLLYGAENVEDLNYPGAGLHPLKGDLKGDGSVTVTGNYRIIFRFENGNAHLDLWQAGSKIKVTHIRSLRTKEQRAYKVR